MKTAIRKHLRDFLAIIGLLVLAGFVSAIILSNQRLTLPAWVPVIGKDFYEFNGAFSTAQAVTPGQGQTVNVAGVKVGEISSVTLKNGQAVVGMKLDKGKVTVHEDATLLLRPKTGLKDMIVELDPGTPNAKKLPEGGTIPVSQTEPDVNLDEVLASLDGDTRTYLQALLSAGAGGLDNRGQDLGDTIRTFEPTAKALLAVNGALATRKRNIKHVIHNFSLLAGELGKHDTELARFVDANNAVFATLASQEASIRATLRDLPGTLSTTQDALSKTSVLSAELGPTLERLLPFARQLAPTQRAVRPFLKQSTPIIKSQVRPLVRAANPVVEQLRPTFKNLAAATPDVLTSFKIVNTALDALAYNPPGPEEGLLFWFAWVNHLGASVFSTQDAHGVVRRGLLIASCQSYSILNAIKKANPLLGTLVTLTGLPVQSPACGKAGTR